MITKRMNRPKRNVPRLLAATAALGVALATGPATAASALAATPDAKTPKTTPAGVPTGGEDDECLLGLVCI
ncbi:hypothetical protein ACWD6P_22550 [Streptomyces sp. NPDC002446]